MPSGKFSHALLLAALAAFPATSVLAQSDESARIRALEEKLERSLELIEALQRKVEALETGRPTDSAGRLDRIERQLAHSAPASSGAASGTPLRGFADVQAVTRSGDGEHEAEGFAVGNLDLYLTPDLGGKVRSLVELVFELEHDGESVAEIERAQVGYAFDDALTVWAGRFHNPFGYWNNAYHHGAQLQTSITRPAFLEFEDHGGILPMHGIGLWATGHLEAAGQRFRYDAYLANAPSVNNDGLLDVHPAGRTDFRAMTGLTLAWQPSAAAGPEFGIHGLNARVDLPTGDLARVRMLGGFATYEAGPWSVIAEGYRFDNETPGASGSHQSSAWFVQAAYAVDALMPFARLERASLESDDPYFAALEGGRSYRRAAMGLRFDLTAEAALKLELARRTTDLADGRNERGDEAFVQYAIRF
ncbi:MAG: hypothetical protein KDG55_15795 [Rhodocyclaceae bacterium]|nr:hypothetical protein [Rhodocyclaceae bacterium]